MNFNDTDKDNKCKNTANKQQQQLALADAQSISPRTVEGNTATINKQENKQTRTEKVSSTRCFSKEHVKEMGRKARLRLEEEKSKRKEIVRLNDDLLLASTTVSTSKSKNFEGTTGTSQFAKAIQQSTALGNKIAVTKTMHPSNKKRRTLAKRSTTAGDGKMVKNKNRRKNDVDTWAPNTSGLLYHDLPKEEKSDMVRIHGLPIGTRVEDLKKFFVGLSPSHFFVLLSYNACIIGFDSCNHGHEETSHPNKEKKRNRFHAERYGPNFRVCVKFPSIVTADVAIQRSGEFIHVNTFDTNEKESTEAPATETTAAAAAAISISPMSKKVGIYIENYLAIDCSKYIYKGGGGGGGSTTILSRVLTEAEKSIPPIANQILWNNATRVLKWKVEIKNTRDNDYHDHSVQEAFRFVINPCPTITSEEQKQHLVNLHNHLVAMYEDLERQSSPFYFHHHVLDPCVSHDNSVAMICQKTVELLLDRISSIQKAINYCNKF
jgi:hypothetical protein